MKNKRKKSGFTLVELLVASSLFVVVMIIMSGAITSVFAANQKSKTERAIMDNLNLSLESMTRTIRFSKNYHCGSSGDLSTPYDCSTATPTLTVTDATGSRITYSLSSNRILRVTIPTTGVTESYYVTSPDLNISNLGFVVTGSSPFLSGSGVTCSTTDCLQPRVVISIKGSVGTRADYTTTFGLETTVSQRLFDFR